MSSEPERPAERSFEDLAVRYLDGTLDEGGLAELNALLAGQPELRQQFNDLCLQTVAISERLAAEKVWGAPPAPTHLPHRRRVLFGAAAAAGLATAAVLKTLRLWPFRREATGETAIARLEDAAGNVFGADDQPLAVNQSLQVGQLISTGDVSGSARIRCADGTYLVLGANTSATLLDGKIERIRLDHGSLAVDVGPRPEGRALRIVTSTNSEVVARGTKVWLESSTTQTRVVHGPEQGRAAGAVRLTRLSDGRSVPIQPGQWAVSNADGDLRPQSAPHAPDNMLVAFARERPPRWKVGELVFDDLPEGSQAAMKAVAYNHPNNGQVWYKVQSNNEWTNGLFTIHEDSWFHVRFRVDKPGFFHCLIVARDPDATRRLSVVLEGQFWMNREPRRWYTVDLPFTQFRPTARPEPRLEKPLIAFIVLFDCQKVDCGLAIDRYWITRGPDAKRV